MNKNLVVVESPAKSKTVARYLEQVEKRSSKAKASAKEKFQILATNGHIRESNRVDIENGFELQYDLIPTKRKNVQNIVKAMRGSDQLFLATDPDREGEAISAHIRDELQKRGVLNGKPVHRIVFHEVTNEAIQEAIQNPGEVSENLVDAQKSRDALDMLVGFNLSPLLIHKLRSRHLSAGRVQSPTLRLIVERQREIEKFKPQEFWTIHLLLDKDKTQFEATLTSLSGKKLEKFSIENQEQADAAIAAVKSELLQQNNKRQIQVSNIRQRKRRRKPLAPFTTSTLVQAASSKLRMSARQTASVAQKLYEGLPINGVQTGLISYMRTDSTTLSNTAIKQIREHIQGKFGQAQLPVKPRIYVTKSKNAQEAHEAIRPTDVRRTPEQVKSSLNAQQYALYTLIWRRAVASQMKDAIYDDVTAEFATESHKFRASGSTLRYPGWLSVYQDSSNSSNDSKQQTSTLPALVEKEFVNVLKLNPVQHFTQPPPRYNHGSLIKQLEEYGIGRPSTWPSIITKLIDRKYVVVEKRNFVAKSLGCIVVDYLNEHFGQYIDYQFTSRLENGLDEIARGEKERIDFLSAFWQIFNEQLKEKKSAPRYERVLGTDPESNRELFVRVRGGGTFLQLGRMDDEQGKPLFRGLTDDQDPSNLTLEKAIEMVNQRPFPRELGELEDGKKVVVLTGRYGPYFSVIDADGKRKNYSLNKDQDPLTLTLEDAVKHLATQNRTRLLGKTDSGHDINVRYGPYGPYIAVANPKAKLNVKLSQYDDPDNLTLEQALKLIEEKKQNPYKRRKVVIKNFDESNIEILDGRYGPYVTNGKINATIPKGLDPKNLDLQACQNMIAEKQATKPKAKKTTRRRRKTTKRTTKARAKKK